MYLTQFRISSHSLRIQTGRYEKNKIARNERYCMYCGSRDIEDTYHFICICPCYSTLRSRYMDTFYFLRPSFFKFNLLMGSTNKSILINLAKYIKCALDIRKSIQIQNYKLYCSCNCCQALNNKNVCALIYVLYRSYYREMIL